MDIGKYVYMQAYDSPSLLKYLCVQAMAYRLRDLKLIDLL